MNLTLKILHVSVYIFIVIAVCEEHTEKIKYSSFVFTLS